jgi:hypothetical protein
MITVNVTEEQKIKCWQFAENIINEGNQFDRFQKSKDIQILRTYVGKLAEYIFYHYIKSKGIDYEIGDMFEIYSGTENVDLYDFVLPSGRTIDIKTASLPFHKRIMIPISQFHLKKDFYVGIKLLFSVDERIISPMSIRKAIIYGYIDRKSLEERPTENFGEGDCKSFMLTELMDIEHLINYFHEPR